MYQELENLHKECFPNKPWSSKDFEDLKKSGCDIIASQNGFIIWRVVADEAEIITIGVRPEFRKSGIASAMLILVENDVKKRGGKKIFLEVAENNIPARKLYESSGYKQIGIRPHYYDNIDALLLEKEI